jgi:hypothetical protein
MYLTQLPTDAIELQEALRKYGHSRDWYKRNVTIWYDGMPRKAYVSESEVKREHEKAQQITVRPPDRERKEDGE